MVGCRPKSLTHTHTHTHTYIHTRLMYGRKLRTGRGAFGRNGGPDRCKMQTEHSLLVEGHNVSDNTIIRDRMFLGEGKERG